MHSFEKYSTFERRTAFFFLKNSRNMETTLPLTGELRQQLRAEFDQISGLPFPVYASDAEGNFLWMNEQAREFFSLGEQAVEAHKIGDYYEPGGRTAILKALQKAPPGVWQKNLTARLKTPDDDDYRKIRFVSKPFFEQGKLQALLCMAIGMSELEWFAEFGEALQVGFFEVDQRRVIAECNANFAEILNYETPKAIKGKPLHELLWEAEEAELLFPDPGEGAHLKSRQLKMRRKDGAMVVVKLDFTTVTDEDGKVARIKGVIRDVTYDLIQNGLPVGLFLVTTNDQGEEIISRANQDFVRIHGGHSMKEVLSLPIRRFHPDKASYDTFKRALNEAAKRDQPLINHFMEIRNLKGQKRNVIANVRYVPDENKDLRVGAVYDVTDHLRGHMHTLAADFSAVLHTFMSTVNGLRETLGMLLKAHGQDLHGQETKIDRVRALAEVARHKKQLHKVLGELEALAGEREVDPALLATVHKFWSRISPEKAMSEKEKDNVAWDRLNLIQVRKHLQPFKNLNFPRELQRSLRDEVDELLRLTSIVSLSISIEELDERLIEFENFRKYLRQGEPGLEEQQAQNIIPILSTAIGYLEEFASTSRVAIHQHFNPRDNIQVVCHKSFLNRAFHNLLHNAIKYSWSKGQSRQPWVDVRVEKKQREVEIVIENWGVPIRKEELDSGQIYQFGQRGKESEDRGRAGTGIGLHDALNIVNKHGGSLKLSSEPTFGNLAGNYSNPYITRAIITLPIAKEQ